MSCSESYTLYKHTAPNGKAYVGITSRAVEERWARGNGYRGNRHLWNAIRKYGWDSFDHEIVETGLSKAEAERKERELIHSLRSFDSEFGYNIDLGGWSCGRISDATKEKISEASKRKWQDPAYREKVSAALKGREFSLEHRDKLRMKALGRVKSDDERALISRKVRGKNIGSENPHARAVVNLDTGERFGCVKDAAKAYDISYSAISMACSGRRNTAGGYRWRYEE